METFTVPSFARRDIFSPHCCGPELFEAVREPSYADDIHDVSRRVPGLCNTYPGYIHVDGRWQEPLPESDQAQGRVWSAAIVVGKEFTKDAPQTPLVQWNQVVEALAPHHANHALAIGIRNQALSRRLQHC